MTLCRAWSLLFSSHGGHAGAGFSERGRDQSCPIAWELATGTVFQPSPHTPTEAEPLREGPTALWATRMCSAFENQGQKFNLEPDNQKPVPKLLHSCTKAEAEVLAQDIKVAGQGFLAVTPQTMD